MSHVQYTPVLTPAPFSQTKAVFDNTAPRYHTRYRAPIWTSSSGTKRYSPHRRSSSEEQISPRHSPRLLPTDILSLLPPSLRLHESSPRLDSPRVSFGMSPQHSPHPSPRLGHHGSSLPDIMAEVRSEVRGDSVPRYQGHHHPHRHTFSDETYVPKIHRERGHSESVIPSRERVSRHDTGLRGINDSKDPNRRNSDSDPATKYLPGYWWMTLDAAEQDGIVLNARDIASHCRFGNSRVLSLLAGEETVVEKGDSVTTYTCTGPWSTMPISLISAVGSVIMILRGSDLTSPYAPSTGVRFDGFYKIQQFGSKLDGPQEDIYSISITLQRILGQTPYEELRQIPRQSQIDDWILYDRLESMSDSSGRSRGDLMQELSRESSRRQSASSIENVPTPNSAPPSAPLPPPPMPVHAPPAPPLMPISQLPISGPPPVPPKDMMRKMPDVIHEDPLGEEEEERGTTRRGSNLSGMYKLSSRV